MELRLPIYGTKREKLDRIRFREALMEQDEQNRAQKHDHDALEYEPIIVVRPYVEPQELRMPKLPSVEAQRKHELNHCPPEPGWCLPCLQGWGKDSPHHQVSLARRADGIPVVQADYMFLGSDQQLVPKAAAKVTLVTLGDVQTTMPFVAVCPRGKGPEDGHSIHMAAKFLEQLGYAKVALMTDGENPITAWARCVIARYPRQCISRTSPRHSPKSIGFVGIVQQQIQSATRTLKCEVEVRYQVRITHDSVIFAWLVTYSCWTLARYTVRSNEQTPYQQLTGGGYHGAIVKFAETIMWRLPVDPKRAAQGTQQQKSESLWVKLTQC